MRYRRAALILVFLSVCPFAQAGVLSRADAVRIALRANPEVLKSREQIQLLDGRIVEEKAAALPDISSRGMFYRYSDPTFLNSPSLDTLTAGLGQLLKPVASNIFEGGLEIRQTLYSFKVGKAIRAAQLARQLGGADLRRAQQQIALETVQAYNAVLFSTELVRVQKNALEQKAQHLDITRNRRAAGVATELEVLRAQVNLENQRAELTRAEGSVELARAQLNALMLLPMDSPITTTDTLQYEAVNLTPEDVISEALASRPDLEVAALSQGVREQLVGIAKAETKPSVDFIGNYGRSSRRPENFLNHDFSKWTAAVNIRFPIFDGRRMAGRIAQAEAEVGKARQDRTALENRIRLQAVEALVKLNLAARLITAAQLNVTQAAKALEMTEANYKYGAATALDITDAQNALVQAETILAQALQQHADARATVNYVMGRDPLESH